MQRKSVIVGVLKDFETLYSLALENGNLTTALRAKELLGRAYGLFSSQNRAPFSLRELSDEELEELIQDLEKNGESES